MQMPNARSDQGVVHTFVSVTSLNDYARKRLPAGSVERESQQQPVEHEAGIDPSTRECLTTC
jgi:hypothetical protein